MTIHGGPTFTQWQRSKLPPSVGRSVRNTYGDLAYWLAPAVHALLHAVVGAVDALSPTMEQLRKSGVLDAEGVTK